MATMPSQSSSGKPALEVPGPSPVDPARFSGAESPKGPLEDSANASLSPTPGASLGLSAEPVVNGGTSSNVALVGTPASRPAQPGGLLSEFDRDVSSLVANLASSLLNLKTRHNAMTSMLSGKAEEAKPQPAETVPDEKKAAPELISVPKISPDEWVHLFETTGLCQVRTKVRPLK